MAYVNYEYYTLEYCQGQPKIDELQFNALEKKAELIVSDRVTVALDDYADNPRLMDCICALAENLHTEAVLSENGTKQSESVGPHSVSYVAKSMMDYRNEREEIMRLYLLRLGLLSRKVYGSKW